MVIGFASLGYLRLGAAFSHMASDTTIKIGSHGRTRVIFLELAPVAFLDGNESITRRNVYIAL